MCCPMSVCLVLLDLQISRAMIRLQLIRLATSVQRTHVEQPIVHLGVEMMVIAIALAVVQLAMHTGINAKDIDVPMTISAVET